MIQQHRITFDSIAHSSQPTDLFESPFFDDTQPPSPSASSAPIPIPHHGANNIQWDAFDFNQHSSPPLAYTPSYASFNSFGSNPDDSHNWGGRAINDSSAMEMNLYDDDDRKPNLSSPHFEMDADYDPKEYDGGVEPSPFLLYDDQTNFGPIHTGNSSRSFGFQQQGSVDPPAFSQRSSDEVYGGAPSPGSTDGSPDDHSRPHSRSRASSVGAHSFHNSPNLSQLDSFKDLNFDPSTEIPNWAFAPQQQQPNVLSHPPSPHMPSIALHATGPGSSPPRDAPSPPNGPRSPPQLLIPEDTPSLFPPGGGLTAPGINIVPSTPVSGGGAAGTTVPFQHVLGNQLGRQAMVNGAMSQGAHIFCLECRASSVLTLCFCSEHVCTAHARAPADGDALGGPGRGCGRGMGRCCPGRCQAFCAGWRCRTAPVRAGISTRAGGRVSYPVLLCPRSRRACL
ncbi:hypothetical protein BOTBODRAFT_561349 [Botryobasidium botryosum FD-172 SS1]|uniref:Uncharacterized protein n=1 Tax=Botryobasidium botryosum (strain FD-172 SS1) TaxID=930990 RepID=A0A067M1Z6_BOTB1|nr:hypothetical protein BOTBODRAFT_561349 [Botryobasidium botryosum FD-172 SS1]